MRASTRIAVSASVVGLYVVLIVAILVVEIIPIAQITNTVANNG